MKPFAIFRIGTHTSSNGLTANFTEIDLEKSAKAYDPSLHEAPLVIGHPRDNSPAQGWVTSVKLVGQTLIANPEQIDPVFEEAVKAGRYKKRSASFYLPDSPNNPKPGTLYLRHVGFVAIPAVKGMPDPEFKEVEEGVITFFEQESDVVPKEDKENPNSLDFAEEKLQFAEEKRKFELRERRFNALQWLDPLAVKGQLSEAEVEGFAQFFAHIKGEDTFEISFGEGDEESKQDPAEFLQKFLEGLPTRIEYGEIVKGSSKAPQIDDEEIAEKAIEIREKKKAKGRVLTYTEAVAMARKELGVIEA